MKYFLKKLMGHEVFMSPGAPDDSFLSGGIRIRIPQELAVVAFWSWNLDVVVF